MATNIDDEILQEFLVEAGEIIEKLGEELVELEKAPADAELLNGIFRGFHTIKGGAGFLNIDPVVALCHRAEDVFSLCRQGVRQLDADVMDSVFRVVDAVTGMLDALRDGSIPGKAEPALLENLERWIAAQPANAGAGGDSGNDAGSGSRAPAEPSVTTTAAVSPAAASSAGAKPADEISDDEFEALLDQLHGKGRHGGVPAGKSAEAPRPATSTPAESEVENRPVTVTAAARRKPPINGDTTLRIDTRRLDEIMNLVGELVLVRNRLTALDVAGKDGMMSKAIGDLDLVTADLQVAVMKSRMQPIQKIFSRFPRVVRDLARSLDKEVVLNMIGEDTDMEKNMVEALVDPLVHLVRNSIDHGIEAPDVRERNGKAREGNIILAASQEGDHINLTIEDDGAGMNAEKLREAALRKQVIDADQAARMSDRECFNLIFLPGFTTKEAASDISGRGVGMDVVKTRIEQLGGSIEIDSVPGEGTRIMIRLPLSLAILPTLMIVVGSQIFALPLSSVVEIFQIDLRHTKVMDGQQLVIVRDKPLPLYHLRHWLLRDAGAAAPGSDRAQVVIVRIGTRHVAFVVDQLLGQEEVVIKPLGTLIHHTSGVSGATITGNGRIALILDVPGLVHTYGHRYGTG